MQRSLLRSLAVLLGLGLCGCSAAEPRVAPLVAPAGGPAGSLDQAQGEARRALEQAAAAEGILLDLERGALSLPASVQVTDDILEYLLVGPRGASHESLLSTTVVPSVLNAALLALGLEPGRNATWERPAEAPPDDGRRGAPDQVTVTPPEGDDVLVYLAWREGRETYFFRVEDVLTNLATGRSMRRHRWVYLGSRFRALAEGEPEVFVADVEGNLVNIAFFFRTNTLLTAALPACRAQTIWAANRWLLPPRGSEVRMIVSREPLERLPEAWEDELPSVTPVREQSAGAEDGG